MSCIKYYTFVVLFSARQSSQGILYHEGDSICKTFPKVTTGLEVQLCSSWSDLLVTVYSSFSVLREFGNFIPPANMVAASFGLNQPGIPGRRSGDRTRGFRSKRLFFFTQFESRSRMSCGHSNLVPLYSWRVSSGQGEAIDVFILRSVSHSVWKSVLFVLSTQ